MAAKSEGNFEVVQWNDSSEHLLQLIHMLISTAN